MHNQINHDFSVAERNTGRAVSQSGTVWMLYITLPLVLTTNDARATRRSAQDCLTLIMPFDIQKYLPLIIDLDLSEKDKRELLQTVWIMMESFVDQAWGVHPVQLSCGQAFDQTCRTPDNAIESNEDFVSPSINYAASPCAKIEKDSSE